MDVSKVNFQLHTELSVRQLKWTPQMHPSARKLRDHKVVGNEESNPEYLPSGDGGFEVYFRNKMIKLDTQAKEASKKKSDNNHSAIFKGCVIYITGYTIPSAAELKTLIVENGGSICPYFGGKSYATHIVAESLTTRKINQYSNCKVVKPNWVVESVKSRSLLDWTRYRTIVPTTNSHFQDTFLKADSNASDYDAGDEIHAQGNEEETVGSPLEAEEGGIVSSHLPMDIPGNKIDIDNDKEAQVQWIKNVRNQVNCMDPDYAQKYFAKSRLHFLSSSKMMLRQRCRKAVDSAAFADSKAIYKEKRTERTILHVDFDSFFVSIALKKYPHLVDKPMCVSHGSDGSDIASCNYAARQKGVSNGMWVGRARKLCPELVCLPYDFSAYRQCSDILYSTLLALGPLYIVAVSVDEALVDVSNLVGSISDVEDIANRIRSEIRDKTGIEVSVGGSSNILLAKLALRMAKPAGYYYIPTDKAEQHVASLQIRDLPGVGRRLSSELAALGVHKVGDLSSWPLGVLQSKFGKATGKMLADDVRGIDSNDISDLDHPTKTVGVEVAWGVRTINQDELAKFTQALTLELCNRLEDLGSPEVEVLTVKMYKRAPGAPFVTPKYLGCGMCDTPSRSRCIPSKLNQEDWINLIRGVVESFSCPPLDFRGLGIHLRLAEKRAATSSIFEARSNSPGKNASGGKATSSKKMIALVPRKRPQKDMTTLTQLALGRNSDGYENQYAAPEKIDMTVFDTLPSQIKREILSNEDDFNVIAPQTFQGGPAQSTGPPSRSYPMYMGSSHKPSGHDADIRTLIRRWTNEIPVPCYEDAKYIFSYLNDALEKDANWVHAVATVDWLGAQLTSDSSDQWHRLYQLLDKQVQDYIVKNRL